MNTVSQLVTWTGVLLVMILCRYLYKNAPKGLRSLRRFLSKKID